MPLNHSLTTPFFDKRHEAFKISAILQIFILLLASIVLDDGELLQFMLLSATTYWLAVAIIMLRRNGRATTFDAFLLKWGYPLAILLTAFISALVPIGLLRHRH